MTILSRQDKDGIHHVFMDNEPSCLLSLTQPWMWGKAKRLTQNEILYLSGIGNMCPICQQRVSVYEPEPELLASFVDYILEEEEYRLKDEQRGELSPARSHEIRWRSKASVTVEGISRARVFEVLDMQDCGFGTMVVLKRPGQSVDNVYVPVLYTWGTLIGTRFTPMEVVNPPSRRYRSTLDAMKTKCKEYAEGMRGHAK